MDSEMYHFFIDFSLFTYYLSCDEGYIKVCLIFFGIYCQNQRPVILLELEFYPERNTRLIPCLGTTLFQSEVETDTVFEIFIDDLHISVSLSLLNACTDFLVEIYKIIVAAKSIKQFFFVH